MFHCSQVGKFGLMQQDIRPTCWNIYRVGYGVNPAGAVGARLDNSPIRKGLDILGEICFLKWSRRPAFHHEALKAGGKDNGKPGLRTSYHPNYYGAFVIDAAGNNIEAVCHRP